MHLLNSVNHTGMIIQIKSRGDLDSIYSINPNHFDGCYARKINEGIATKQRIHGVIQLQYLQDHVAGDNQLSLQDICSPDTALRILTNMCRDMLKDDALDKDLPWLGKSMKAVDTYGYIEVNIPVIFITTTWYNLLEKHYGMSINKLGWNLYSIKWEYHGRHHELLPELYFVMMMLAASNDESYLHETQIVKAIKAVPSMPYFFAYLAGHRLVRSAKLYEEVKPLLEDRVDANVNFVQGNTHDLRIKTITEELDMEIPILDIGCGELKYAKKVAKNFKSQYYAFDIEDQDSEVYHLKERRGMDVHFTTDLSEFHFTEPVQVIMSEVIEHMTIEDIVKIAEYLEGVPVHSIYVTTPNVEFNENYGLNGFRHPEHLREVDKDTFVRMMSNYFSDYEWEYSGIGDTVNGEQPTHYAKVKAIN